MRDFRKLEIWNRRHGLALGNDATTTRFPQDELSGLTSQVRRAAFSTPAVFAEGCGRGSAAEPTRFPDAHGFASEAKALLLLARDLKVLAPDGCDEPLSENARIKRMIGAFPRPLNADS